MPSANLQKKWFESLNTTTTRKILLALVCVHLAYVVLVSGANVWIRKTDAQTTVSGAEAHPVAFQSFGATQLLSASKAELGKWFLEAWVDQMINQELQHLWWVTFPYHNPYTFMMFSITGSWLGLVFVL